MDHKSLYEEKKFLQTKDKNALRQELELLLGDKDALREKEMMELREQTIEISKGDCFYAFF